MEEAQDETEEPVPTLEEVKNIVKEIRLLLMIKKVPRSHMACYLVGSTEVSESM